MKSKANRNRKVKEMPLLVDVEGVAGMIGCSKSHVWRMVDGGKLPSPVKVGALTRWRRADVEKWMADGCPRVASAPVAG